jgi:hypothetical protein
LSAKQANEADRVMFHATLFAFRAYFATLTQTGDVTASADKDMVGPGIAASRLIGSIVEPIKHWARR